VSKPRQIISIGGGGFGRNPGQGIIEQYILDQTKKRKPKICFIPTATGDLEAYKLNYYATFANLNCQPTHLDFFKRTPDLEKLISSQDAIFVGGGNTKSMLAVWRDWGLDQILKKYNSNLKSIDIKNDKQKKISSSELKKLIKLGEIEKVNKNLSKDYFINGKIVEGKKLGRELGYPTANLEYSKDIIIPKDGIYKTKSIFKGENFKSITSIGNNPTFNEKIKTIETYIIDFNKNIYGEDLKIIFKDFVRNQVKFENKEDLITQMDKDLKKVSEES